MLQWNISLQREVVRDLVVEAAFVGNKGVWESNGSSQGFYNSNVGNLINYDAVSPATLAQRTGSATSPIRTCVRC